MAEHPPSPPPPEHSPPPQPHTPVQQSEPAAKASPQQIEHLRLKATALLLFTIALVLGAAFYLMQARGFFEPKQKLVLVAENAEGVAPGMDLTFAGFPIGRVTRVSLGDQANVHIEVQVNEKDAKWLRTSSVFTLVKPLFGESQLRAYTGVLSDPLLPDGAERPVLSGDAQAEIQRVVGAARDLLENLDDMTGQSSELNRTVENLQSFTRKLQGERGALHAVFGNERDAQKLVAAIERATAVMARVEVLAAKADSQVFGSDGLVNESRATVRQLHALLGDARESLKRVDAVLVEAQGVGANLKAGTADLGAMRADVEANLRKIEDLINDLNRKWPFAKEREVTLP